MIRRQILFIIAAMILVLGSVGVSGAATVDGTAPNGTSLKNAVSSHGANVIFMRHALAPGYGDPDDFDIADCNTQRNLDARGRQQAQELGQLFQSSGLTVNAILSSRWCRCQDTAIEMNIGAYRTHDGLNSFFQDHVDRDETLGLLREELSTIKSDDVVLMITHQVVIQAITGISPRSGGMVLFNSRTGQSLRF